MIASCKFCDYFEMFSDGGRGYCRRKAPSSDLRNMFEEGNDRVMWPVVSQDDWCGEGKGTAEKDEPY